MVGCYYDVHATIAQVVMCCQASDCYSQSSQLGKTADWISPLVVWVAPSSTKKTGKEQASMPIPAWCLHILWVKYMVSLAIASYYCVLWGNQGHWQYLVMFGGVYGTSAVNSFKEVTHSWHWSFGLWCLVGILLPQCRVIHTNVYINTYTYVYLNVTYTCSMCIYTCKYTYIRMLLQ